MKQSYIDYFRSIDTHSPISSEFRIRTLSGALISVFTLVLTIYLIGSEYTYNLTPTILDHVHVMPQSPDGLEVEFDITFPHIPCALLATDASQGDDEASRGPANQGNESQGHASIEEAE